MSDERQSKDDRFYEPRNWDRKMVIDDESSQSIQRYCGKCGHIIYEGDRFCTKCGAEARKEN